MPLAADSRPWIARLPSLGSRDGIAASQRRFSTGERRGQFFWDTHPSFLQTMYPKDHFHIKLHTDHGIRRIGRNGQKVGKPWMAEFLKLMLLHNPSPPLVNKKKELLNSFNKFSKMWQWLKIKRITKWPRERNNPPQKKVESFDKYCGV